MLNVKFRSTIDLRGRLLPWVRAFANASGVYVIRSVATKRVLYVGESHTGRLLKTCRRHFQRWKDAPERRHPRFVESLVDVAMIKTGKGGAVRLQDQLIQAFDPMENRQGAP